MPIPLRKFHIRSYYDGAKHYTIKGSARERPDGTIELWVHHGEVLMRSERVKILLVEMRETEKDFDANYPDPDE